jgi:hypothetical protein
MVRRKMLVGPEPDDIIPGDFVTRGYLGPSALVISVDGDHATIAWDRDNRDVLPLTALRRAPQYGSIYDNRRRK